LRDCFVNNNRNGFVVLVGFVLIMFNYMSFIPGYKWGSCCSIYSVLCTVSQIIGCLSFCLISGDTSLFSGHLGTFDALSHLILSLQ